MNSCAIMDIGWDIVPKESKLYISIGRLSEIFIDLKISSKEEKISL